MSNHNQNMGIQRPREELFYENEELKRQVAFLQDENRRLMWTAGRLNEEDFDNVLRLKAKQLIAFSDGIESMDFGQSENFQAQIQSMRDRLTFPPGADK